jgi:hypothetical protein
MNRSQLALVILLIVGTPSARALDAQGNITAGEMTSWCEPYRAAVLKDHQVTVQATRDSRVCFGAFMAIQQLSVTMLPGESRNALRECLPPSTTLVELIKVFIRYSDMHPEMGHWRFTDVALNSLAAAFPCPPT